MVKELTTTPASSEIGRLAQLLKAAGLTIRRMVPPPRPSVPGSDAMVVEEWRTNPEPALGRRSLLDFLPPFGTLVALFSLTEFDEQSNWEPCHLGCESAGGTRASQSL